MTLQLVRRETMNNHPAVRQGDIGTKPNLKTTLISLLAASVLAALEPLLFFVPWCHLTWQTATRDTYRTGG